MVLYMIQNVSRTLPRGIKQFMTSMKSVRPIDLPQKFATVEIPDQDAVQESPATDRHPSASSSMIVSEEPVALQSHITTPNSTNKQDTQTSAVTNLAAPPQCTRPQPVDGSTDNSDENLLQASPNYQCACQTTRCEPKIPSEEYTHSPYSSPGVVSSVLPPELLPYSPSSRSSFRRLSCLPAWSNQAVQANRDVLNNQAFILRVHIEMGYLGAGDDVQHDREMSVRANRRLKICLLVLAGYLLVVASLVVIITARLSDINHLVFLY